MEYVEAKDRLMNVLWLGGSPCAGKSSISQILGRQTDFAGLAVRVFRQYMSAVVNAKIRIGGKELQPAQLFRAWQQIH